jgi:predicted nuclease of predicted toxin-antitoxin system
VRILLDEQLPRQLARQIEGHEVRTVQQQGWAGLRNGELLRRAAADRFEVFVTADQNLQFQQNLTGSSLAVIVLVARSNALEDLIPIVPALRQALTSAGRGEVRRVTTQD